MLEAVIFDLDGVMIDTDYIQSQAFEKVLADHGIKPKKNEHGTVHISGASTPETWELLKKEYGFDADTEYLTRKKRRIVMDILAGELTPLPGLLELLEDLSSYDIKVAIATSAQRERLELVVDKLGIKEYIYTSVSADDIKRGKPSPDTYIEAAKRLGIKPENCIVFEDAEVGVEAAKTAGMKVIAVPHRHTRKMNFSNASYKIGSLAEIDYKKILEIFKASDNI